MRNFLVACKEAKIVRRMKFLLIDAVDRGARSKESAVASVSFVRDRVASGGANDHVVKMNDAPSRPIIGCALYATRANVAIFFQWLPRSSLQISWVFGIVRTPRVSAMTDQNISIGNKIPGLCCLQILSQSLVSICSCYFTNLRDDVTCNIFILRSIQSKKSQINSIKNSIFSTNFD